VGLECLVGAFDCLGLSMPMASPVRAYTAGQGTACRAGQIAGLSCRFLRGGANSSFHLKNILLQQ